MTNETQSPAIGVDGNTYELSALSEESRNLVAAITNNRNLAQIHEQTKQQLDIANTALTNALKTSLEGVEPSGVEEAAQPAPVEIVD